MELKMKQRYKAKVVSCKRVVKCRPKGNEWKCYIESD